jgi:hypothetical protein
MQKFSFSVLIPEGKENEAGYVVMEHGTKYTVVLRNNNAVRADARLEIDGKHQGTWRLPARDSISLERPGHDTGHFTFYKAGSSQGSAIGLDKNDPELGLIKVTFTPEKEPQFYPDVVEYESYGSASGSRSVERSAKSRGFSAGGTGLSGSSNQSFGQAKEMDLDLSSQVVIHLRLVAQKATDEPRPLTSYSTPVPPPVG